MFGYFKKEFINVPTAVVGVNQVRYVINLNVMLSEKFLKLHEQHCESTKFTRLCYNSILNRSKFKNQAVQALHNIEGPAITDFKFNKEYYYILGKEYDQTDWKLKIEKCQEVSMPVVEEPTPITDDNLTEVNQLLVTFSKIKSIAVRNRQSGEFSDLVDNLEQISTMLNSTGSMFKDSVQELYVKPALIKMFASYESIKAIVNSDDETAKKNLFSSLNTYLSFVLKDYRNHKTGDISVHSKLISEEFKIK